MSGCTGLRCSKPSAPLLYSLAGPVVWYGPVQRDSVAEVCVVAVLLPQVFSIALLSRRQSGRKAAFTSTPEALDQTQRLGQTCVRPQGLRIGIRTHLCSCDCISVGGSLIKVSVLHHKPLWSTITRKSAPTSITSII